MIDAGHGFDVAWLQR